MKEKVVLAYSGGLDTTAIIPWLKETFDYDVICVCADCGQEEELDGLEERALSCGAAKLYIEDVTDEFCDNYVVPCVQAHAVYENKYLLGTSMARPVIAKRLVEIARKEGAVAICHGATGKGNDQIRFQISRSSHLGEIQDGLFSHVKMRLNTADSMVFIFHSALTQATAVTVTYGISATKVLSLKILLTSLTTSTFLFLDAHQRMLLMKANMLL